ncbi:hypothetical protein GIX45_16080 [Erwinia sp. CPCC 100877]|nr:hypothetical protein [Erwinia sp. CPCC 100877]
MDLLINLAKIVTPAVITYIFAEFQYNRNKKRKAFNQKYAPYLHKYIFKKYLFSIELHLFETINAKNKESILNNVSKLHDDIYSNKKIFVIIDNVLLDSIENLVKNKTSSLKTIQKKYNHFSLTYLYNLNRTRNALGMPPRNDTYLKTFHLHKEKYFIWFSLKKGIKTTVYTISFALILTFLGTIFLASLINFIHATEKVLSSLTNI